MSITKVNSLYEGSPDGNPFTTAGNISTIGASAIVACVNDNKFGSPSTLTDLAGNTYGAPAITIAPTNNPRIQVWVLENPLTHAANTWTVSAGSSMSLGVLALAGTATSSSLDQTSTNEVSGSTTLQPGLITPTVDNEIVISGIGAANNVSSVDAPFTPFDGSVAVGTDYGLAVAFEIQTTATARNPTWTWSFGVNANGWILSIKPLAGASALPFVMQLGAQRI